MPVGTGSISRAAKSAAPKKTVKKAPEVPVTENVKAAEVKTKAPTQGKTKNVKAKELKVYGEETVFAVGNECCHLTEELPVHLL